MADPVELTLPATAAAPPSLSAADRSLLADRLTEEVVQLLYVVRQDLCELDPADPALASSARCRTSDAISTLREIADALRGHPAPLPGR
jgi:hypothetical protein